MARRAHAYGRASSLLGPLRRLGGHLANITAFTGTGQNFFRIHCTVPYATVLWRYWVTTTCCYEAIPSSHCLPSRPRLKNREVSIPYSYYQVLTFVKLVNFPFLVGVPVPACFPGILQAAVVGHFSSWKLVRANRKFKPSFTQPKRRCSTTFSLLVASSQTPPSLPPNSIETIPASLVTTLFS